MTRKEKWDFSGYATKCNVKCADGRTIRRGAFADNDGTVVPLVWQHQHNTPDNVLGHALLEERPDGIYAYGKFNHSPSAQAAMIAVAHGDVNSMSIYANNLQQRGGDVIHGVIREVSLVLSGANPEAVIDNLCITHGNGDFTDLDDEANMYFNQELEHVDMSYDDEYLMHKDYEDEEDEDEETVQDVIDGMTDKQKDVMYYMVGEALNSAGSSAQHSEEGEYVVKRNVFYGSEMNDNSQTVLTHDQMTTILDDAKRCGSLKESVLQHAEDYGIKDIETLFPDAKNLNVPPAFIERDRGWVPKVLNGAKHTPFSRIKSMFADITEDEARARGYIKGNLKKEEVFTLLKRSTDPQTVYKKQKLDRDDVIDITDFDVVAWIRAEMRVMLDEELARAALVGDGRMASSDDKIQENHIRPIFNDEDLFTIKVQVSAGATTDDTAKNVIRAAIKSRKDYKGSGSPTLFTTEDWLTDMLLLEDGIGHPLYADEAALARKMRVKEIVTVPVMENMKGPKGGDLIGIIVNMSDYTFGADKGGQIATFEDFDIDYNQQKYLIETRCSGALIKPFSAITLEAGAAG